MAVYLHYSRMFRYYQSVILHFDIDTYWIYTANYFREIIYHVYKSVLYIIARFFRFTYDTMKA